MRTPHWSPWGQIDHCQSLCPGVYEVDTPRHGGIMVEREFATAIFSQEALRYSFLEDDYYCFEEDCDAQVAIRELLDQGLVKTQVNNNFAPGEYETVLNNVIRRWHPEYWAARQNKIAEKEDVSQQQKESSERYDRRMDSSYEVVVYHHLENGFDEKLNYQSLAEAEQAAQKYVDGTMEGEDGFAYEGAGIYDLQGNKWLRFFGDFPDERAIEQAAHALAAERSQQPEDRYTIYQVKREDFLDFGFLGYDEISKYRRQFSSEHYREVYSGKLIPGTALDDLFREFNVNRPADFTGHSLSVSDVVVLHRDGKDTAYYCDMAGWREVPEFLSEAPATQHSNEADVEFDDDFEL